MSAKLSIFVDESGDFGLLDKHSPYYIVAMVLHKQSNDISREIKRLDDNLAMMGLQNQAIHTGPLVRRENPYQFYSSNERYKEDADSIFKLDAKIARDISRFIRLNLTFFQKFSDVVLYYDNGQHELNRVLNTVLAAELSDYDIRKVLPSEYRLFQVADLLCTLELLTCKIKSGMELTRSETLVFHSKRDLKKDFLRRIERKRF